MLPFSVIVLASTSGSDRSRRYEVSIVILAEVFVRESSWSLRPVSEIRAYGCSIVILHYFPRKREV